MSSINGIDGQSSNAELVADAERQRLANQTNDLNNNTPPPDMSKDGATLSAQAVDKANTQQDAGQSGQNFLDTQSERSLPASVEELAKAKKDDEQRTDEQRRITAADLQAQLTLQSGRIRG